MSRPRVTVGLAVYNGAEFLESAIESILAQTYTDFELIISDNASTDDTEKIGRRFAELDRRVLYSRNPVNIGGVRNENRTMSLARGEFFKLAAHDDLINPGYLEHCVAELDRHPRADVCVPTARVIDGDGAELDVAAPIAGLEARPADRMRAITDRKYMCEATYGVIRTSALRSVRPQANRTHSDRVVLCELALQQPFVHASDAIIWRRLHAGNQFRDIRGRMVWFQPELQRSGMIRLPHWRHLADVAVMMLRVEVGPPTWIRCWAEVARVGARYWRSLAKDLAVAAGMLITGKSGRLARYRRAGGDLGDTRPARSVLLVAGDLGSESEQAAVSALAHQLTGAGNMATVLVSPAAADRAIDALDRLRLDGVPIQVCRRATGLERRTGPLGALAATVAAVVDSGADSIHLMQGGQRLLPHLRLARRVFLRGVNDEPPGPPTEEHGR